MNKILEAEELAFLADLMAREAEARHDVSLHLPQASPLMPLVGQASDLALVARYEHHELHFPVALRINQTCQAELIVEGPTITEFGLSERQWRFRVSASRPAADAVRAVISSGQTDQSVDLPAMPRGAVARELAVSCSAHTATRPEIEVEVLELSENSILLRALDADLLTRTLCLRLFLGTTREGLRVEARRVRLQASCEAAYRIYLPDAHQAIALRWFLFRRHPYARSSSGASIARQSESHSEPAHADYPIT